MSKRIALLQSNYIPWKGYFDIIGLCDEFILYDEVQYTKNDWRNRNQIKTAQGLKWLTIPVKTSDRFGQRIDEVSTANDRWRSKHWRTISQAYAPAPHFSQFAPLIEDLYLSGKGETSLSGINTIFIAGILEILKITTPVTSSTDYPSAGNKTDRILRICRQAGATHYLSGPAARSYIDPAAFEEAGIELDFITYDSYPTYPQLHDSFEHAVTILDLIFSVGDEALNYMQTGHPPPFPSSS